MLTNVNVYSNAADYVCSPVALVRHLLHSHPLALTVARVLNLGVAGCECFASENSLHISSIALLELMHLLLQRLLLLLQGAGIYVDYGGEATLTNSNVYENEAGNDARGQWVSALNIPRQFLHCSARKRYMYSWLAGRRRRTLH